VSSASAIAAIEKKHFILLLPKDTAPMLAALGSMVLVPLLLKGIAAAVAPAADAAPATAGRP